MLNYSYNTIICAVTVLVSFICFSNSELLNRLLHIPYLEKKRNEWYRLLTSGFIHADTFHLLFNMIALFSFGSSIEAWFNSEEMFSENGSILYLIFYLSAIIAPGLITYNKHQNNSTYAALGASGAVSAVIFASIIHNPFGTILIYFIPIPALLFGVLYIWYESYMSKKGNTGIGHDAHLYGALYGVLFILALKPYAFLDMINQIRFVLNV